MESNFQELKSHYMDYMPIYTDGSKDDMKVGCAVVSDDFSGTMRIPDGSSIFTAEAKAIGLALDLIADCETSYKFFFNIFRLPFRFKIFRPYIFKKSSNSKATWKASWFSRI